MSNAPCRVPRPLPHLTSVRPSVPPPLPPRRISGRVPIAAYRSGSDTAVTNLCERLSRLEAELDALSAVRLCLDVLARVIPCRAMLAHSFDAARREFVVVHARGESAESMVLERHPCDDPLLRVAMPAGRPFVWTDLRRAPVNKLARYTELPSVKTVMVCPVATGARWLGAIELVDPLNCRPFQTQDVLDAKYVADRYARFAIARGIVVDVAAIAHFANADFMSKARLGK